MSRDYCFTSFNEIKPNMEKIKYIIYQPEICPSTNKKHYQGYVEFYKKTNLKNSKIYLGDEKIHLEKRHGSRESAKAYCKKTNSKNGETIELGKWEISGNEKLHNLISKLENNISDYELIKMDPEIFERYRTFIFHSRIILQNEKNINQLKYEFNTEKPLNENQLLMIKHISQQNNRQITWTYDFKGGCGKTWLSKYIIANMNGIRFTNGRSSDIAYAYNGEPIIVFDFSRSNEEKINYQIIEDLKNGILFSCKYSSKCKVFIIPKIIIMANFLPDTKKLSEDRWDILLIK